jgi:hypothetical protein
MMRILMFSSLKERSRVRRRMGSYRVRAGYRAAIGGVAEITCSERVPLVDCMSHTLFVVYSLRCAGVLPVRSSIALASSHAAANTRRSCRNLDVCLGIC